MFFIAVKQRLSDFLFQLADTLCYGGLGNVVDGILAQATSNERELTKHLWDQKLHSLTHTLVVSGRCDLKKSDILAYEEKAYLVLAVDNAGDLGVAGIAYLEERNDLK